MSGRAFVSLGSNVGDRALNLGSARVALIDDSRVRLVSSSQVIETEPVDVIDQPMFLNQVVGIVTTASPRDLLDLCLRIERTLGRDRSSSSPGGPREIDLDILLYGGREIDEDGLTVPHPRLAQRPFFLDLCRAAGAPNQWLPSPVRK